MSAERHDAALRASSTTMRRYPVNVSVIFPARDEAGNIEACVIVANAFLAELVADYEIIVVDDGSSDRTGDLIAALQPRYPKVRCITHPRNVGYGAALRTGFKAAIHEYLFFSDSDRQFDILDLKHLLAIADQYDIVVGYRRHRMDPAIRKFAAFGYNQLVRLLFGVRVRDIDCAFKLFHRRVLDSVTIESERFFVNTEILAKAHLLGYSVAQVPVTHLHRTAESSTVRFSDVPRTLRELVRIRRSLKGFRESHHGR